MLILLPEISPKKLFASPPGLADLALGLALLTLTVQSRLDVQLYGADGQLGFEINYIAGDMVNLFEVAQIVIKSKRHLNITCFIL